MSKNFLKAFIAVTFLAMITINALANVLPLNGISTGDVSDSYPNLFAPAGITFSIWGLIYFLLAAHTLYQLGLFRKKDTDEQLLKTTGLVFSVSSLINFAWIFAWHYRQIGLSMFLMVLLLVCLIYISLMTSGKKLSSRDSLFIRLPFSVYFGWITVATIANATTLFVDLNWNGFGVSEPVWTIIILAVGAVIGSLTILKQKDIAYGLVLVFAFSGILLKHVSSSGFSGQYTGVITASIICIATFIACIVLLLYKKDKHIKVSGI